jgi:tRNA G18 (ribose-2'-O)-methylase SpoU
MVMQFRWNEYDGKTKFLGFSYFMQFTTKLFSKIEYLFGSSVVIPALESRNRRILKLFVSSFNNDDQSAQSRAIQLATQSNVPIEQATTQRLNKLSEQRPNQVNLINKGSCANDRAT